jgi:hypothetical protein
MIAGNRVVLGEGEARDLPADEDLADGLAESGGVIDGEERGSAWAACAPARPSTAAAESSVILRVCIFVLSPYFNQGFRLISEKHRAWADASTANCPARSQRS